MQRWMRHQPYFQGLVGKFSWETDSWNCTVQYYLLRAIIRATEWALWEGGPNSARDGIWEAFKLLCLGEWMLVHGNFSLPLTYTWKRQFFAWFLVWFLFLLWLGDWVIEELSWWNWIQQFRLWQLKNSWSGSKVHIQGRPGDGCRPLTPPRASGYLCGWWYFPKVGPQYRFGPRALLCTLTMWPSIPLQRVWI